MTLISAGDAINSLAVLNKRIQWVKCPFCDDEVSKLRPCVYWTEKQQVSWVCVECAESVKGLVYLAIKYPVPGVDVEQALLPLSKQLPSRFVNERSYKAHVTYGDWGFLVWPKAGKLSVLEDLKPPDQEKSYDNAYQVWFALKQIFSDGKQEELLPRKGERRGSWQV